jgi:CPA2 family monovalent cation:H+ antiporter-2
MSGESRGVTLRAAILMGSTSETGLIVLSAAVAAGLVSRADGGFWQIVIALGLTLTPLLARVGQWLEGRANTGGDGEQLPAIVLAGDQPRAVIAGFGRVGRLVADMLDRHGKPYVAIDSDIDTVISARHDGYPVLYGDTARVEMIERLRLDTASALVLTMDDPVGALGLVRAIRASHPQLCIVARARDAAGAAELYRAGVTDAVPETVESSLQLSEAVLTDLGVAMGPVIASIHDKRAELRAEIMRLGETDRPPPLARRRMGDAGADH